MKRTLVLLSAVIIAALATHVAYASPKVVKRHNIDTNVVHTITFPITETGVDSFAVKVNGLCSVVYESAGSDDASLYAVPTNSTATGSGTLIVAYTASSTVPTIFQPGTRWVRAVAVSAVTGGSVMRITCSNTQMASVGEACGTSGLAPYVGDGARYKCESDYSYDEALNKLSVDELLVSGIQVIAVAGENALSMEGNATYTGDVPTGTEVLLYPKTDGDWYMSNSSLTEERVSYTSAADHYDLILFWGVDFTDISNEYAGTPTGGIFTQRFCMEHTAKPEITLSSFGESGDVVIPLNGSNGCGTGYAAYDPLLSYTVYGDPYFKKAWCVSSSSSVGSMADDVVTINFTITNRIDADEKNVTVATVLFSDAASVTEHGVGLLNSTPLSNTVENYASSFFVAQSPGDIGHVMIRAQIDSWDRIDDINDINLQCAIGMEFRL